MTRRFGYAAGSTPPASEQRDPMREMVDTVVRGAIPGSPRQDVSLFTAPDGTRHVADTRLLERAERQRDDRHYRLNAGHEHILEDLKWRARQALLASIGDDDLAAQLDADGTIDTMLRTPKAQRKALLERVVKRRKEREARDG